MRPPSISSATTRGQLRRVVAQSVRAIMAAPEADPAVVPVELQRHAPSAAAAVREVALAPAPAAVELVAAGVHALVAAAPRALPLADPAVYGAPPPVILREEPAATSTDLANRGGPQRQQQRCHEEERGSGCFPHALAVGREKCEGSRAGVGIGIPFARVGAYIYI